MPYIGNTIRAADDYRLIDDISSSFNGSTTSFALQVAGSAPVPFPKSPQQVLISVNGVIQEPDPTGASGFNLVGTNIVFSSAPTNGHAFFGIIYATADYLNSGGNFPSGSLGAPSITFVGDEDTGIYRKGSGSIGFVSNSTEIANTDSNGITISSGNLILGDSSGASDDRIKLGAGSDLSIYHTGSHSYIENTTNFLFIHSNSLALRSLSQETFIDCSLDGAVDLYYDNTKRFETTSTGIKVTGTTATGSVFLGDFRVKNTDDSNFVTFKPGESLVRWHDSDKAVFGASNDLQIYHDGTNSIIDNTTGELQILTDAIMRYNATEYKWNNAANSEKIANFFQNGACELYFDHSKKFETLTDGVNITGTLKVNGSAFTGGIASVVEDTTPQLGGNLDCNDKVVTLNDSTGSGNNRFKIGNGGDLQIYHDGTDSYLANTSGALIITQHNNDIKLKPKTAEDGIIINNDGSVELYHNNVKTVETSASHLLVFGNTSGNHGGIKVRNTNTGAHSRAEIRLEAENAASFATIFCDHQNTNLRLGYNSTGTTVAIDGNADMITGTIIPNTDNSKNLGSASFRWANIFTTDLKLSNEGSQNDVDGTWGNYTIQEGHEDLFLINHRTGKKFKFNLTEVA